MQGQGRSKPCAALKPCPSKPLNKKSLETIEGAAKWLRTPTAQQARGYLAPCLETALKVLDAFADGKPHDYDEVAEITGFNHQTCRQVLHALNRGGYGLTFSPSLGYQPIPEGGRPTVTAQTKKKAGTGKGR